MKTKKEYGKTEWQEFRNEILELVMFYRNVKEHSAFDKEKIEHIQSFFYLSRHCAITSFFIKVGFLVTKDGKPSLFNFLPEDKYNELYQLYKPKIRVIRNKVYAHSDKSHEALKAITLTHEDVEELYAKIILSAQEIDKKYNDPLPYDKTSNGIKGIESLIDDSIELEHLKTTLLNSNFKATVELEKDGGKIKICQD